MNVWIVEEKVLNHWVPTQPSRGLVGDIDQQTAECRADIRRAGAPGNRYRITEYAPLTKKGGT